MFLKSFGDFGVNFSHINPPYVTPCLFCCESHVFANKKGRKNLKSCDFWGLFYGPNFFKGLTYRPSARNEHNWLLKVLGRHYEKTNEAIFYKFFDPFFFAKTWASQKTVITIGSGVKTYARGCIQIATSSTDDPISAFLIFSRLRSKRFFFKNAMENMHFSAKIC